MRWLALISILLAAGAGPAQHPETLSLLGKPLYPPPIDSDTRKQLETDLAAARTAYDAKADADAALRLGQLTASLGRFGEAIEIYTRAIEAYPNDTRLYAERGSRFIALRKFDLAIRDLSRSAQPPEGKPVAPDPDVQYNLGLAHYMKAEFSPAAEAFRVCLETSKRPEAVAAASAWLYITLQRLRKPDEAKQLIRQLPAGMDASDPYVRLLGFYTGTLREDSLDGKGADAVTLAYGTAVGGLWSGSVDAARSAFKRIVEKDVKQWTAPGYIAAEAELARLSRAERRKLKLK